MDDKEKSICALKNLIKRSLIAWEARPPTVTTPRRSSVSSGVRRRSKSQSRSSKVGVCCVSVDEVRWL